MAGLYGNTSAGAFSEVTTPKLVSAIVLTVTSLFGVIMNSLYIWVLRFKMTQSINTTWFFHGVIGNLIFILDMPFLVASSLKNPLWTFGVFMCKLSKALTVLCRHITVSILTVISIERYLLVFHPIWCRKYFTVRRASIICLCLWVGVILFSTPYLIFCNVEEDKNMTTCCSEFTFSWKGHQQTLKRSAKWGIFFFDVLLNFLFPLCIIIYCYLWIAFKIKQKFNSRRSYSYIGFVIASFFICWTPYHIMKGMLVERRRFQEDFLQKWIVFTICLGCFNSCFTPILYLFIVDGFNKEFKKAVRSLISKVK